MKYYEDELINCPFYKKHTSTTIYCESLVSDKTNDATYMKDLGGSLLYRETYCRAFYQSCPKYQALWNRYKKRDENDELVKEFKNKMENRHLKRG